MILGLSDREVIDGKPHFGLWLGEFITIDGELFKLEKVCTDCVDRLKQNMIAKIPEGCETRHEQIIMKPPTQDNPLNYRGSIGIKYMIWGQAYKVMRLLKKGTKRYAKKTVCGRRKWVRIDNEYKNNSACS